MPDVYEIYEALGIAEPAPALVPVGAERAPTYMLFARGKGKSRIARILRLQYNLRAWGL